MIQAKQVPRGPDAGLRMRLQALIWGNFKEIGKKMQIKYIFKLSRFH
jgi:hypothetical protein